VIVLGIDGSPHGPGKTARVISEVLQGAAQQGATVAMLRHDAPDVLTRMGEADAVVFGSPTYRASHTSALRSLLERVDRDGDKPPLAATPAMVVMTGGSPAHFLGADDLANTLRGFFGTQVLSPSLYFHPAHFDEDGEITDETAAECRLHGNALGELTAAVRGSTALRQLKPLV
jgi:FMN reductase